MANDYVLIGGIQFDKKDNPRIVNEYFTMNGERGFSVQTDYGLFDYMENKGAAYCLDCNNRKISKGNVLNCVLDSIIGTNKKDTFTLSGITDVNYVNLKADEGNFDRLEISPGARAQVVYKDNDDVVVQLKPDEQNKKTERTLTPDDIRNIINS
jgi:hypothetical protein